MSQKLGNLYIVSGPSGVGKSTTIKSVLQQMENIVLSVSCTTRDPRPQEIEGVHYYYLNEDGFQKRVDRDGFLEHAGVHKKRYGTPRDAVMEHLRAGQDVILDIDVQGHAQVMAFNFGDEKPKIYSIFIQPPSIESLRQRIVGRGDTSASDMEVRLAAAESEMAQAVLYNHVLISENDGLDSLASEAISYIAATRLWDGET